MTRKEEDLPLGIVLERRRIDNPWKDHAWKSAAVIPGAAPMNPEGAWTELTRGERWVQFHAGTLPLRLFPGETEGYRVNLSQEPPRLFVVLRDGADVESDHDLVPFLVTACPYEAQDYLDSGEEVVEAVPMPEGVVAFVQGFVDRHHVDAPFHKRKRKRWAAGSAGVGRRSSARQNGNGGGRG